MTQFHIHQPETFRPPSPPHMPKAGRFIAVWDQNGQPRSASYQWLDGQLNTWSWSRSEWVLTGTRPWQAYETIFITLGEE